MSDDLNSLDRKVAELEGWVCFTHTQNTKVWTHPGGRMIGGNDYPPPYSKDWAWCGPLVEKYLISLTYDYQEPRRWWATSENVDDNSIANTPQEAICLAVITLKDNTHE